MQATSNFNAFPTLSGRRFWSQQSRPRLSFFVPVKTRTIVVISAKRSETTDFGRDHGRGGHEVDEGMVVLRMRIRELEMSEASHTPLPSNWMEWEEKYYNDHYNEDVCEAVGLLQLLLMNTRPCVALGMAVLLTLSVPISTCAAVLHAADMAKAVFSGLHLGL